MLHNYSEGAPNGRIWILWNEAQVDLVDVMDQCITCSVTIGFQRFNLSAVYASNDGGERRRLWSHLLIAQNANAQYPWLITGDFNVTAHVSESSNSTSTQNTYIKEFKECLNALGVFDHIFTGPVFTWSNHQEDSFIAKKLDRVLINDDWQDRKSVV